MNDIYYRIRHYVGSHTYHKYFWFTDLDFGIPGHCRHSRSVASGVFRGYWAMPPLAKKCLAVEKKKKTWFGPICIITIVASKNLPLYEILLWTRAGYTEQIVGVGYLNVEAERYRLIRWPLFIDRVHPNIYTHARSQIYFMVLERFH